jgi:predicted neuraminidase
MHVWWKWSSILAVAAQMVAAQTVEFVADSMPTPSRHASTIVELKDGNLLSAWFGGASEGAPDVAIWGARRTSAGWQAPSVMVREPSIATYNPVLFHSADGVLWLYYKFGPKPDNWTAGRLTSRDEGATWSPVEHLPAGVYGPIRAKPLVRPNGVIISGTSVESYNSWACWIERSTDNGKTWTRHGPVTVAPDAASQPGVASGTVRHGIIQPVIVPMAGKRLRLYARSTPTVGRICVSDSSDDGLTWSPARAIDLPNPNAGIDVVRLRDGRFVLVYNHTAKGRTPLNLAVSSNGDTWQMFHALESEPGEYSYPAMIQGRSGDLYITYTWQRKKVRYVRWPLDKIP